MFKKKITMPSLIGSVKFGKPTSALIHYIIHASKKELRRLLLCFITSNSSSDSVVD